MARTPLVQTMDWPVMEAYLNTEVERLKPDTNDAILSNPDGTYYFTGIGLVEGKTVIDRAFFQTAMAGEAVVSEPVVSRASGVQKVNIAVPIGEESSPRGVFSLGLKIESIQQTVRALNQSLEGQDAFSYVFVLDAQGRAIVHPNPDLVFNQDRPDPSTLLEQSQASDNREMVAVLEQMLDRQTGSRLVELDGRWQYIAYLPLQEVDWSIALVIPQDAIDGQLRPLDRIATAAGILIVAIICVLSLWQVQTGQNKALRVLQAETAATNEALEAKTAELRQALSDLQQAQYQIVQNEKMASIGQLTAGIAHEINNPVNFIHGNLTHVREYCDNLLHLIGTYQNHYPKPEPEILEEIDEIDLCFLESDLPKILQSMEIGTKRIREIVLSLRNFSRLDSTNFSAIDIHDGIDSTLIILQHRLKTSPDRPQTQVLKDYGELPSIEVYAGPLNQVLMNILANAIDALEDSKQHQRQIQIRTAVIRDNWIEVAISDNGIGIPKSVQNRIFDPFFTTKPVGKGTGMGMYISYQVIAEKHGGRLACESESGKGTTFRIQLPIAQAKANSD